MTAIARLQKEYNDNIRGSLTKEFSFKNPMEVPKIEKIVINMGVGEALRDSKSAENAFNDLMAITGQKPVLAKAKKSIATFRLREGAVIGCKVTLRRKKMYEFLDRVINIALPRVRDFRGLSVKSFDGNGNISFGIKEQIIFPEIEYDQIDAVRGMDITIVTSAKNAEEAKALIKGFNMPFYN